MLYNQIRVCKGITYNKHDFIHKGQRYGNKMCRYASYVTQKMQYTNIYGHEKVNLTYLVTSFRVGCVFPIWKRAHVKAERLTTNNQRGEDQDPLSPLRRFWQVSSYTDGSSHRFASQKATLQARSVQIWKGLSTIPIVLSMSAVPYWRRQSV